MQIAILERLSFFDLLSIAQSGKHFADVAAGIFRRKYVQKIIKFDRSYHFNDSIVPFKNTIVFSKCEEFANVLNVFGNQIQSLSIEFSKLNREHAMIITDAINKIEFDALKNLEIISCPEHFWRDDQKPFSNVESVIFDGEFDTKKGLRLNQIFPNIQQMTLNHIECNHLNFFNCNFPKLKELIINSAEAKKLLSKNPQIENVTVNYATQKLLKQINKHLPQLKSLSIRWLVWNYFNQQDGLVRFENVQNVYIKCGPHRIPVNVAFPHMTTVELAIEPILSNDWIDYIALNGEHLTKFHIYDRVMDTQLLQIAEKFTNLTEASINCGLDVASETLVKFVKANIGLRKIALKTPNADIGEKIKIALQDEWNVQFPMELESGSDLVVITLERK